MKWAVSLVIPQMLAALSVPEIYNIIRKSLDIK